jgi:hypothetical protein
MQHQDTEGKKSKRYVLCKKVGDAVRPCAFFGTPKGCRSGSACPFSHGETSAVPVMVREDISSLKKKRKDVEESSDDEVVVEKKHKKTKPEKQNTPKHVKDTIQSIAEQNVQALGSNLKFAPFSPPGFSKIKEDSGEDMDDSMFLFSVVNTALQQGQIASPFANVSSGTTLSSQQALPLQTPEIRGNGMSSGNFFLPKDHVSRVLESAGTPHATQGKGSGKSRKSKSPSTTTRSSGSESSHLNISSVRAAAADLTTAVPIAPALFQAPISSSHRTENRPVQAAVVIGNESWAPLVTHTVKSSRFQSEYIFERDLEWVQAKPFGSW